jgi:hypothetical protein
MTSKSTLAAGGSSLNVPSARANSKGRVGSAQGKSNRGLSPQHKTNGTSSTEECKQQTLTVPKSSAKARLASPAAPKSKK